MTQHTKLALTLAAFLVIILVTTELMVKVDGAGARLLINGLGFGVLSGLVFMVWNWGE